MGKGPLAFSELAVSLGVSALGVDVEPLAGPVPEFSMVRDAASPDEFSAWSALPEGARRSAFVRLWTLKEAALKARGAGLASGMAKVRVRDDFSCVDEIGMFSRFVETDARHAVALAWCDAPEAVVRVESISGGAPF